MRVENYTHFPNAFYCDFAHIVPLLCIYFRYKYIVAMLSVNGIQHSKLAEKQTLEKTT
jgi:hypothetical protein